MIGYSIMAHHDRARMALALAGRLGAPVAWDEKGDRWDTGKRAWQLAGDTQWHVVIQDDAVLPRGFEEGLEKALARVRPGSPLVLYAGATSKWYRLFDTVPRETSYLVMRRIVWGVGIAMPTRVVPKVLAYGDRARRDVDGHYDLRLSLYFESKRIPVWYSWPSLVNHRNGPSLVPGRGGGRHAYCYCSKAQDYDGSVLDLSNRTPLV